MPNDKNIPPKEIPVRKDPEKPQPIKDPAPDKQTFIHS